MSEIEIFGLLLLLGEQAAEHLLGGWLHGTKMKIAAIAVTVGMAYLLRAVGLEPLTQWSLAKVGATGVIAGLGSNIGDTILKRLFPAGKEATLSKGAARILKNIRFDTGGERPPSPPGR